MKYSEKLLDPRWQRLRLEVFERDGWECQYCGDNQSTLHCHHIRYKQNADPWDYGNDDLKTLCEYCHGLETDQRSKAENALLDILKPCSVTQVCKIGAALCMDDVMNSLISRGAAAIEEQGYGTT